MVPKEQKWDREWVRAQDRWLSSRGGAKVPQHSLGGPLPKHHQGGDGLGIQLRAKGLFCTELALSCQRHSLFPYSPIVRNPFSWLHDIICMGIMGLFLVRPGATGLSIIATLTSEVQRLPGLCSKSLYLFFIYLNVLHICM